MLEDDTVRAVGRKPEESVIVTTAFDFEERALSGTVKQKRVSVCGGL